MDRKNFLKSCGAFCFGGIGLISLLQSCGTNHHFVQSSGNNELLTIPKSEFIKTDKEKVSFRKFVLTRSEKFNQPICVFRLDENKFTALLMLCTHNGCELQPQGDYLICPCHGSEFSNLGVVQNPPAELNLKSFKVSENHESVFIHL